MSDPQPSDHRSRLASALDGAGAVTADEEVERADKADKPHLSRRGRLWLVLTAVVLVLGLLAYSAIEDSEHPNSRTGTSSEPRAGRNTSTTADVVDLGLNATTTVIDARTLTWSLVNTSEQRASFAAWQRLTARFEATEPQRYRLNLLAPAETCWTTKCETDRWRAVDAFDVSLQGGGLEMAPGDTASLTVSLPPGLGPGPHLLQIGYEVGPSGDATNDHGLVEVRFNLPTS